MYFDMFSSGLVNTLNEEMGKHTVRVQFSFLILQGKVKPKSLLDTSIIITYSLHAEGMSEKLDKV